MSVYEKPCRYRLKATSYIDGVYHLVATGENAPEVFVDYAGNPGLEMVPTCDEGARRQAAYFASKKTTMETAAIRRGSLTAGESEVHMLPPGSTPAPQPFAAVHPEVKVPIPEGWDKGNAGSIILLAAKLGAPETVTTASGATEFIKAEIARRLGHAVAA